MGEVRNKSSNYYITRFLASALLFTVTAGIVAMITRTVDNGVIDVASSYEVRAPIIVFDPGHGGEDPGAISNSGVPEKDINLIVGSVCSTIMEAAGFDSRMTRQKDCMLYDLYDDLDDYHGKMKTFDLKNRIRFSDECDADLMVSVHLNKFFQPQYGGLQVYYSPNSPDSERFATAVQNTVKTYLDNKNDRQVKRATSSIYLLKNIKRNAILVECGFLSNPKDLSNLTNGEYQLDLSASLCASLMNCFRDKIEPVK